MSSVRQLITRALRLINYVEPGGDIPNEIMDVGQEVLDAMIQSWSNDPLMIYSRNPYAFPVTAGLKEYTLGPGGDWDIKRPMDISQAYVNWNAGLTAQVDLPVAILTDSQYASISVKNTPSAFAFSIYNNGNYPLNTISCWPVPNQNGVMTLWLVEPLIDYDNIDDEVQYPPGYYDAFCYSLAVHLGPELQKEVPQSIVSLAMNSKAAIAKLNSVPQYLSGDAGLTSNRQRQFNYITGNFVQWRP